MGLAHRLFILQVISLLFLVPVFSYADQAKDVQLKLQQQFDDIDRHAPESKLGLTNDERKALLKQVVENSVAKLSKVGHYDPDNLGTGFCFGRAMTAHMLARKMELKRSSILKLFIAGDMPAGSQRWRFHVTTLVKDAGSDAYFTIDPVMVSLGNLEPLTPAKWMEVTRATFDPNKTTKFYVTDPDAVMVDMRVVPSTKDLENHDRIIEITFDPESKPGFELEKNLGDLGALKAYRVDNDAREKYFINRSERVAGEEFDFLTLPVTILRPTETKHVNFDYHNYFVDLFGTF